MSSSKSFMSINWSDSGKQQLVLKIRFGSVISQETLLTAEQLLDEFFLVGSHGGFVRENTPMVDSLLICTKKDLSSSNEISYYLEVKEIDVRSFNLLENLARKFSAKTQPIVVIEVIDQTPNHVPKTIIFPPADWGTEEEIYLPEASPINFLVEREDPHDYRKNWRCLIEFSRPVQNEYFDMIIARINEWVSLVTRGVFSPPVKSPEEAVYGWMVLPLTMNIRWNLFCHFSKQANLLGTCY